MNVRDLKVYLAKRFSVSRFQHIVGVSEEAVRLACIYGVDEHDAEVAGLLHDYAKHLSDIELLALAVKFHLHVSDVEYYAPQLLHGPVGAILAKGDFPELNDSIIQAIRCHTTGEREMGDLAKIIYVVDIIEPNRHFPGVAELRSLVGIPLDLLTVKVMDNVISYLIDNQVIIDPKTIAVRNDIYYSLNKSDQRR